MSEVNNFVYLVMQHDIRMGKEWVMYAYDNYTDAEEAEKKLNKEDGSNYPRYFVKSVRYFRKEGA
jgi:hypothetical protein